MPNAGATTQAKGVKVLIIEDDAFLQKILVTKFTKEGFDVVSTGDGSEAIGMMKAESPSFVLLDLILPGMNGFEILAEMRTDERLKRLPVFVLSNLGQQEDIARAKELGAIDFLVKTDLSINEVVAKVKEAYAKIIR